MPPAPLSRPSPSESRPAVRPAPGWSVPPLPLLGPAETPAAPAHWLLTPVTVRQWIHPLLLVLGLGFADATWQVLGGRVFRLPPTPWAAVALGVALGTALAFGTLYGVLGHGDATPEEFEAEIQWSLAPVPAWAPAPPHLTAARQARAERRWSTDYVAVGVPVASLLGVLVGLLPFAWPATRASVQLLLAGLPPGPDVAGPDPGAAAALGLVVGVLWLALALYLAGTLNTRWCADPRHAPSGAAPAIPAP